MALAWSPLITLADSILAFLGGVRLWSTDKSNYWTLPVFRFSGEYTFLDQLLSGHQLIFCYQSYCKVRRDNRVKSEGFLSFAFVRDFLINMYCEGFLFRRSEKWR